MYHDHVHIIYIINICNCIVFFLSAAGAKKPKVAKAKTAKKSTPKKAKVAKKATPKAKGLFNF